MAGLYNMLSTPVDGDILYASDYIAEHQNHINNHVPAMMDDYSANVSQMQETTDPGEVGSESLATSLAEELKRLRFMLAEITGKDQWYESPATNLELLGSGENAGKLAIGLEFEGPHGSSSSTTDILAKLINQGAIINAYSYTSADVNTDDFDSSNVKFGNYSYKCESGNVLAFPGWHGGPVGKGTITAWFKNLAAGDYIAYNPLLGIELYLDSTGYLTAEITEKTAASETAKSKKTVKGSVSRAGGSSFDNVIMKWKADDDGSDLLKLLFNNTSEGTQITSDSISISKNCDGGIWFFGAKKNEPSSWGTVYVADSLPNAAGRTDTWSYTGSGTNTVSDGILTMSTSSSSPDYNYYYKDSTTISGIDFSNMVLEWKCRITEIGDRNGTETDGPVCIKIRDSSNSAQFHVNMYKNSISIVFQETSTKYHAFEMYLDMSKFHVFRLMISGGSNPDIALTIDGEYVWSGKNYKTLTYSYDWLGFGCFDNTSYSTSEWEYIRCGSGTASPFATANTQGYLDSIGVINGNTGTSVDQVLQNSKISAVYGEVPSYGITVPKPKVGTRSVARRTTSTSFIKFSSMTNGSGMPEDVFVPGDGVSVIGIHYNVGAYSTGSASPTVRFAYDLDGDTDGKSSNNVYGGALLHATSSSWKSAHFERVEVLPVGLHLLTPVVLTDTGDEIEVSSKENTQYCSVVKQVKL